MSFFGFLCFAVFSLCAGGILGNLLCIILGLACKQKYLKQRITVIFLFFSLATAFFAFAFIKDIFLQFEFFKSEWLYFCCIFTAAFFSAVFWKIVLPLCFAFYVFICAWTGIMLYGRFGPLPEKQNVTLNRESVIIEENSFYVEKTNSKKIVIEVYTLPEKLILPLPRVWYSVAGITDADFSAAEDEENILKTVKNASGFVGNPKIEENEKTVVNTKLQKLNSEYFSWILKKQKVLYVPLPQNEILPSVYTLIFKTKAENLTCRLEKNL